MKKINHSANNQLVIVQLICRFQSLKDGTGSIYWSRIWQDCQSEEAEEFDI